MEEQVSFLVCQEGAILWPRLVTTPPGINMLPQKERSIRLLPFLRDVQNLNVSLGNKGFSLI